MDRFRVKAAHKTWGDKGPDLLRKDANAIRAMRAVLGGRVEGLFVRRSDEGDKGEWQGPFDKGNVMDLFKFWTTNHKKQLFAVGEKQGSGISPVAQATYEHVPIVPLANCSKDTEELHSLIHYQFDKAIHSGGFLFRQVSGSTAWSDHAWGTAIDESQNTEKGVTNDEVFDWQARMAQSGNINPDYILGSRDGKVVQAVAPDYEVEPSSAASSHLWHCHTSQVDHDGRKPPRNPMFP